MATKPYGEKLEAVVVKFIEDFTGYVEGYIEELKRASAATVRLRDAINKTEDP